jgi:hypothetical protein
LLDPEVTPAATNAKVVRPSTPAMAVEEAPAANIAGAAIVAITRRMANVIVVAFMSFVLCCSLSDVIIIATTCIRVNKKIQNNLK